MNNTRGTIRNRKFYNQIKDYSNLKWGKITPTDIDGFIDFGNKLFVFIELKFKDAELERGQELALERITDSCDARGHRAVCIVANYETEGDVDVANCIVQAVRIKGRWAHYKNTNPNTVDGMIDILLSHYAPEYLE